MRRLAVLLVALTASSVHAAEPGPVESEGFYRLYLQSVECHGCVSRADAGETIRTADTAVAHRTTSDF